MPRKEQEIRVVSYVHVGDRLVGTSDLGPVQKQGLATWIRCTYLNTLFEGEAKFSPTREGRQGGYLSEEQWEQYLFWLKGAPAMWEGSAEGG